MFTCTECGLGERRALTLRGPGCELSVIPDIGATVHSLTLAGTRILRADEEHEIAANPLFRGRILFPWNDRIEDARYRFRGREHHLLPNAKDGSAIHGFLYRSPTKVEDIQVGEDHASLSASFLTIGEPGYPFECRLIVRFELRSNTLGLRFNLLNLGGHSAPVAAGWHPYFDLGCPADDLVVQLGGSTFFPVDAAWMPYGYSSPVDGTEYDFLRPRRIGVQDLDIAFESSQDRIAAIWGSAGRVLMESDRGFFKYIQVYIPPERDSIAIEPVSSITNAFNLGESGYIVLEPGQSRETWIRIRFEGHPTFMDRPLRTPQG